MIKSLWTSFSSSPSSLCLASAPLLKVENLKNMVGTSDYKMVLESFIEDYITKYIGNTIYLSHYAGFKGVGTEHMVALVARPWTCATLLTQ